MNHRMSPKPRGAEKTPVYICFGYVRVSSVGPFRGVVSYNEHPGDLLHRALSLQKRTEKKKPDFCDTSDAPGRPETD